ALVVGGRATAAYRPALMAVAAIVVEELAQLGPVLESLRHPNPA
ncbi:MAG: hypothetical protein RLZZ522_820, partial [Verrucomicrobiota bacterium]